MMKKGFLSKSSVHILLLVAVTLFSYSNTLRSPFIFDDIAVIVENPIIKDLRFYIEPSRAEQLKGTFQYQSFKNRYVGSLTFAVNYRLNGLDVTGYHVVNIFIHIINVLLLYLLVVLSFRTPYLYKCSIRKYSGEIAVFTAFLFACHPVQTEAVTYIWQRVTSLATLFYLFSLVMYVKSGLARTGDKRGFFSSAGLLYYTASLVSAVLAMKTKQISFTLPLMALLYESMFFEGKIRRKILYLLPLLLTMLIIPLSMMEFDKPAGELFGQISEVTRDRTDMSRLDYLFTQFRVVITYIRLLFLPINQNLAYDYPIYRSLFDLPVFLSSVVLLLLLALAIYIKNRAGLRFAGFGIFWFFIALSVESSVIPILGVIYEHRVYLPSIGVFMAATVLFFTAAEKFEDSGKGFHRTAVAVLSLIVVVLCLATYSRNNVWKSRTGVWQDVAAKSPDKAEAHYNLGLSYQSQGFIEKSIDSYRTAIHLKRDYTEAYINLGVAYKTKGLIEKAIEQYLLAIQLNPDIPEVHNNLGSAYMSQGSFEKAVEQYRIAIRLKPDYSKAYYNLGNAYNALGLSDKARRQYRLASEIKSYKK
jgi:tetratricopeptide (TPR) repeat protein